MVRGPRARGGDQERRRESTGVRRSRPPEDEGSTEVERPPEWESRIAAQDIRRDLRDLRGQIEALREAFATVARPYSEFVGVLERLQDLSRGYLRLLDLVQRHGAVSPNLAVPGVKDDISRHIVSVLLETPDRNISQITEAVKARRGTASRRIVRRRLEGLARDGLVVASHDSRNRTFRVSEEVEQRWSQVLGFPKYGDRPGTGKEGGNDE